MFMNMHFFQPGTIPQGLSQGKLQKLPSHSHKYQTRRPDPMWTSYRSNEGSTVSSGSESSVEKCGQSPTPLRTGTPTQGDASNGAQRDVPSQWEEESQSELSHPRSRPQSSGENISSQNSLHGIHNGPQENKHNLNGVQQNVAQRKWGLHKHTSANRNGVKSGDSGMQNSVPGKSRRGAGKPTPNNFHSTLEKPGKSGSDSWGAPPNGSSESWDEPQNEKCNAWGTAQTDALDKAKIGDTDARHAKSQHSDHPSGRSFREKTPPRFRHNSRGTRAKQANRTHEDVKVRHGGHTQMAASVQVQKDSRQPTGKEKRAAKLGGDSAVDSNPWNDWEDSVVIKGALSEEDMVEIGVINDNDDMSDVFVNQYISAMQEEKRAEPDEEIQLTPSKIQQLSKLKSTAQADVEPPPPGTMPCPRKVDRWGGHELRNNNNKTGWGDLPEGDGNWYDDGSSAWGNPGSTPGWG